MLNNKYDIEFKEGLVKDNISKIINQIFSLLPLREEDGDWQLPLNTIIEEMKGMESLFNNHKAFFPLINKLEGLRTLKEDEFFQFRRTIFESLNLMKKIGDVICQD